jgi:O-antigen/teichoic acid export membrane protein
MSSGPAAVGPTRRMLLSGGVRVLGFIPQAIGTLLASRLILTHFGVHAFTMYALVMSVMALLPLNNLGVGASVTQAVAAHGPEDERSVRAALTAARVLSVSTLGVVLLAVVLGLAGLWPRLLGDASGANTYTAVALIVYAVSFVPGLAQSVLLGADRNHVSLVVGSFLAPFSLVVVIVLLVFDLDGRLVVLAPSLSLLMVNLVTLVLSMRLVRFPWLRILREVPRRHRYPGARIRSLSGPMLVTSLCVPLAFCTDRIVLSHVSTQAAVANYSVVLQLCAPIMALIVAAAQPLWPMYTRARALGERGPQVTGIFLVFGGGTLVLSTAMVLLADPVGRLIGGDAIDLGYFLPVVAALVMCLLAIAYPLSMSLVDPAGARFVAVCAVITLPVNMVTSIWLSKEMGAAGPLVALFVVSLTFQVVPVLLYSSRRQRSGQPVLVTEPEIPVGGAPTITTPPS